MPQEPTSERYGWGRDSSPLVELMIARMPCLDVLASVLTLSRLAPRQGRQGQDGLGYLLVPSVPLPAYHRLRFAQAAFFSHCSGGRQLQYSPAVYSHGYDEGMRSPCKTSNTPEQPHAHTASTLASRHVSHAFRPMTAVEYGCYIGTWGVATNLIHISVGILLASVYQRIFLRRAVGREGLASWAAGFKATRW